MESPISPSSSSQAVTREQHYRLEGIVENLSSRIDEIHGLLKKSPQPMSPVQSYFTTKNAMFTELTFENFVCWHSVMKKYRRSYPDEWDNSWHESFGSNMRKTLYNFNFSPTAKARNEFFSRDIIL